MLSIICYSLIFYVSRLPESGLCSTQSYTTSDHDDTAHLISEPRHVFSTGNNINKTAVRNNALGNNVSLNMSKYEGFFDDTLQSLDTILSINLDICNKQEINGTIYDKMTNGNVTNITNSIENRTSVSKEGFVNLHLNQNSANASDLTCKEEILRHQVTNVTRTLISATTILRDIAKTLVDMSDSMCQIRRDLNTRVDELYNELTTLRRQLEDRHTLETQMITTDTCESSNRHLVGRYCYYIEHEHTDVKAQTWWDARYSCKQAMGVNADLAVLSTAKDRDELQQLLTKHYGDAEQFWVGASVESGTWKWLNGRPIDVNLKYDDDTAQCMTMYQQIILEPQPCYQHFPPLCQLQVQ